VASFQSAIEHAKAKLLGRCVRLMRLWPMCAPRWSTPGHPLIRGLCAALLRLALGLGLSAAGCGAPQVPHRSLTIAMALFPGEAIVYRKILADFESISGTRVQLITEPYGDILHLLQAESGAGHGRFDLIELDIAALGQARDDMRELDPSILATTRKLFPEAAWRVGVIANQLYFVPHRIMWQSMVYNRLKVPRPPADWEELARFVRAHPGKFAIKGGLYEGVLCDVLPFIWEAGGSVLQPTSADTLTGLDFLAGLAPGLNPRSAVFREMSVLEAQARGEVWIHFNWPFAMGYLHDKGLAPAVDLSAPIPAGPKGRATVLGGGYLGIPRSAPNPDSAQLFLRFLLTSDVQQRLVTELGWQNVLPAKYDAQAALLYAGFSAMRPYMRTRATVPDYQALSNRWQRALAAILFEDTPAVVALKPVTNWVESLPYASARPAS
jgi:ABC-type glycerol-3-phosphate transport system substrate-binding protein